MTETLSGKKTYAALGALVAWLALGVACAKFKVTVIDAETYQAITLALGAAAMAALRAGVAKGGSQ